MGFSRDSSPPDAGISGLAQPGQAGGPPPPPPSGAFHFHFGLNYLSHPFICGPCQWIRLSFFPDIARYRAEISWDLPAALRAGIYIGCRVVRKKIQRRFAPPYMVPHISTICRRCVHTKSVLGAHHSGQPEGTHTRNMRNGALPTLVTVGWRRIP